MSVTVIPASHLLPSEKMSRKRKNNDVTLHFLFSYRRVWQTLFSTGSYPLVENHLSALHTWTIKNTLKDGCFQRYPYTYKDLYITNMQLSTLSMTLPTQLQDLQLYSFFLCCSYTDVHMVETVENCQDSRHSHFVKGLQMNYTLHCFTKTNRPPTSREKQKT